MRLKRQEVSAAARSEASWRICEALKGRDLGEVVAVYLASPDEIDLTDYIRAALFAGVHLMAPRWTGETYELAELRGLDADSVRTGPHGILEPREAGDVRRPATWLVPGLAFTRDGKRLGYGGGWYDRLMADDAHARKLGVAYAFQLVADLPSEPHDILLSEILTEHVHSREGFVL